MLLRLHKIAQYLAFCRPYSIAISFIALLTTIYSLIVDSPFTAHALEPAIAATLWALLLFAFLQMFQTIPEPVLPHDGIFKKLAGRFILALYSLLAFIVVATSILLFWMSFRLLMI